MTAVLTLTLVGIVFGLILGFTDKFCYVEPDERVETITNLLPGINCGACGFPGCEGLANAIVDQEGKVSDCKPIKPEGKEEIYKYLETAEGPNGEKIDVKKVA